MTRRPNDFYPTPPCASIALREWLERVPAYRGTLEEHWQDPAAGYGQLLQDLVDEPRQRSAIELDDRQRRRLGHHCHEVIIGDALEQDWDPASHIVMNPPFNQLEAFHRRGAEHADRNKRVVIMLTRTGYWQAAARNVLPRPDRLLLLTWRPSFDGSGRTDSFSYCWALWDRRYHMREPAVSWLERPSVSRGAIDAHRYLAEHAGEHFDPSQAQLL